MSRFCLILFLFLLAPGIPRATAASLHPQDGAHADIRVRIEGDAVRMDIMMNLAFADSIAPTQRESPDALPEVEAPMIEEAVVEYFRVHNRVVIDGVEVTPTFSNFAVLRPGLELLPLFPRTGMRGLLRVGIDLTYPAKSPPKRVAFTWGTFPPDLLIDGPIEDLPPMQIEAQLSAEGRIDIMMLSADEPEYIWHSTGKTLDEQFAPVPRRPTGPPPIQLPILSISLAAVALLCLLSLPFARQRAIMLGGMLVLCIAAVMTLQIGRVEMADPFARPRDLPDESEALRIFEPLHANIYRAFDYSTESDIYDALSRSVDGRLLDRLYSEVYRSLILYEEGGAVSRVKSVMPMQADVLSIGPIALDGVSVLGFEVRARWQVEGQVYHWGHSHTRINEYEADYTVVETTDGWRIAANTVREQFRVELEGEFELPPPGTEL